MTPQHIGKTSEREMNEMAEESYRQITGQNPVTPQPRQPTVDEILAHIAKNQAAMMKVIESHEVQIKRLQFRLGRIEEP